MSGEASGLLLLPLVGPALPVVGAILVGGAVITAGAYAAAVVAELVSISRETRSHEREQIMNSGLSEKIGSFRSTLASDMDEQARLNQRALDEMMSVMNSHRAEMQKWADPDDPGKYQQYISEMRISKEKISEKLADIEDNFVRGYHEKIMQSMAVITDTLDRQRAEYLNELEKLNIDIKAKERKAGEIAKQYLEEAKTLLLALKKDRNAAKFSGEALLELQRALNDAITLFNNGQYEAAIGSAKDTALRITEEIYRVDCKKQEFDNYHILAVALCAELEAFMTSQEYITTQAKAEVERRTGKTLEDDVVGVRIADYTDRMQDGGNMFDHLLKKIREIKAFLQSEEVGKISTQQMKEYVEKLSGEMYQTVAAACNKGILNMNNAFSRQNVGEQIVDFFEEHNFRFDGYAYDEDRHDGTLHIGLSNDTTGEEIVVTLAPEIMENGDVQTKLEINQLKGDETNEERKQFYRDSIGQVVRENTPGAKINLSCKQQTKNKLSSKTELRDKLKA